MHYVGERRLVLEGRVALTPPVLAWFEREVEMPELVVVLRVHTAQDIGNPARAALPQHELHPGVALQSAREDDAGQELSPGELEQGEASGAPLGGILLGHLLIRGLTHGVAGGVEGDRDMALLSRGPQRIPVAMPDRL